MRSTKSESKSKKPTKKVDQPKPVTSKLPTAAEREQVNDIDSLAKLVKELLSMNGNVISSSRSKPVVNPLARQAERYISVLHSANCKIEAHHALYRDMFSEHRHSFLKSVGHEDWMKDHSINIHLGKGTDFENRKMILKISVACTNAYELRENIKNASYKNENMRERALGSSDYQYLALFYFRLLIVIKNALGEKHRDHSALVKLIAHYQEEADLLSEEDEDTEKPKGEGINRLVNDLSGGKAKIDSKNVVDVIEKVTSNSDMIDKITDTMREVGNNKGDRTKVFAKMAEEVAPVFMDIFDSVAGGANKEEGSGSESGSESSSEDD